MIKDPVIAEEIRDLMFKITNDLNQTLFKVQDCCPEEEFRAYRRVVGRIMREMLDFLEPAFREHPELKPKEWD